MPIGSRKQLGAPEFRIVDAAWYLPAQNRNGAEEYAAGHIPGAVYFDQDVIADHTTGLPHSIPSPEFFAAEVGKLGIAATDTIVVHDGPGFFSAPRACGSSGLMGAEKVYVLDGGLDGWKREGRPLQTDLPEPAPAIFTPNFDASRVTTFEAMKDIVPPDRSRLPMPRRRSLHRGRAGAPRRHARRHMPGAKNLPIRASSPKLAASGRFPRSGKRSKSRHRPLQARRHQLRLGVTAAVITRR